MIDGDVVKLLPGDPTDKDSRPRRYCSACLAGVLSEYWDDHADKHRVLGDLIRGAR